MMNSLKEIADLTLKYQHFVITGHINPDGDCMGSMLALANALKYQGKSARVIIEGPLPDSVRKFADEWDYEYAADFRFGSEDELLLALDSGDPGRLPELPDHDLLVVNIDHHLSNAMYGDYNHVDEKAAAAGEIIYHLIRELGVEIDQKIATYLAIALITDTGNFRYSNTKPNNLRLMADLMELGVSITQIHADFLGGHSIAKIRLKGLVYSRFQTAYDGKVAYMIVDQKLLTEVGATIDDAGSLSGELRDIRGVEVGFTVLEVEPGYAQLGFRSNNIVPVNLVAQAFGGGGHLRASGAQLKGDLHQITKRILETLAEYLE